MKYVALQNHQYKLFQIMCISLNSSVYPRAMVQYSHTNNIRLGLIISLLETKEQRHERSGSCANFGNFQIILKKEEKRR